MAALDTSVLIAAMVEVEPHHQACDALLDRAGVRVYAHALAETFNTLTGGRCGYRLSPKQAAELIEDSILPYVEVVALSLREMMAAMNEAQPRGVRGAAIFDYLHLVAARKAKVRRFYTLDVSHFQSFHRPGDPEIAPP
ncbi:MAG: PIN domain-containing protein [Verrucomicrobiota bacterium]|nr:PIN domain-containing protein [Verrucomicrobiota bacterium]